MWRRTSQVLGRIRRIVQRPASGGAPAELIEIGDAIIEDVAKRCHALPGGSVFPFSVVEAGIYAGTDDRRLVVEQTLGAAAGLPSDIRRAIQRQGCTPAAGLKVTVIALDARPGETDWRVEYSVAPASRRGPAGKAGRQPCLVVVSGEAQQAEFPLRCGSFHIGRGAEVRFSRGVRRNDIIFRDNGAIGRAVSRDHARIDCDSDGNCVLVHQSRNNKTELRRRDGQPYPISAMGRPTELRDGDEIRLGEALLRFEVR